jgi:hypothetical protein
LELDSKSLVLIKIYFQQFHVSKQFGFGLKGQHLVLDNVVWCNVGGSETEWFLLKNHENIQIKVFGWMAKFIKKICMQCIKYE